MTANIIHIAPRNRHFRDLSSLAVYQVLFRTAMAHLYYKYFYSSFLWQYNFYWAARTHVYTHTLTCMKQQSASQPTLYSTVTFMFPNINRYPLWLVYVITTRRLNSFTLLLFYNPVEDRFPYHRLIKCSKCAQSHEILLNKIGFSLIYLPYTVSNDVSF